MFIFGITVLPRTSTLPYIIVFPLIVVFLYSIAFPCTDKSYGTDEFPITTAEPIDCTPAEVSNILSIILLISNAFDILIA